MTSQGSFSMQNGNGHKNLPGIDRANKVTHGSSKALANGM